MSFGTDEGRIPELTSARREKEARALRTTNSIVIYILQLWLLMLIYFIVISHFAKRRKKKGQLSLSSIGEGS